MDIPEIIAWAQVAFPYSGAPVVELDTEGLPSLELSAARVASAYEYHEYGANDEEVLYRLGTGLNGLANYLRETDAEGARDTFAAAFLALSDFHDRDSQPERFTKAIGYALGNFKGLGGEQATCEGPPSRVLLDLTPLLGPSTPDAPVESTRTLRTESRAQGPESATALFNTLSSHWTESTSTTPVSAAAQGLLEFFAEQFERSDLLARDLGTIFREDVQCLVDSLTPSTLPLDSVNLAAAAQEFRQFAFDRKASADERRLRWLTAAMMNYTLLRMPGGLSTNAAQVQIDLMGYVAAIQMDHRYSDPDRDLLLDSSEAELHLCYNMPPIVVNRFRYIRDWLLASIGTYLILSGPNPSRPSDNYYDERIHSDSAPAERGLGRARRRDWPEMLLEDWQQRSDTADGACFAIASLCGWDLARSSWAIDRIFEESHDAQRELSRTDWNQRISDLLSRVERVRIATNPWRSTEPTASRGTIITNDATGRFIVPDGLLKAAVAQGLKRGEAATVQGHLFEGRRIPTYLLSSKFGPFAILKIDHRDKVLREVRNFESSAKRRLHPSHRPSECTAYEMDMYLGEDGAALRAITTSYVFDEDDEPLTLGTWLRTADSELAAAAVEAFMLKSLRPWLAHVRRDRVDIRAEYPTVRPVPAPNKQQPTHWAAGELTRLESAPVAEALGFAISREGRDCDWIDRLGAPAIAVRHGSCLPQLVNPLWLAAELAETGTGELASLIDHHEIRDYDTLLCLSHGDLHLDNVLCTSAVGPGLPRTVLIDFESTHEGHVCKDIARLEASVLCQVFELTDHDSLDCMVSWFADSVSHGNLFRAPSCKSTQPQVDTIVAVTSKLRWVAQQCGQGLWPIREEEYLLALFAALLPMVRWESMSHAQRRLALLLATLTGSAFVSAPVE